jgi:glycosyltransferase involved in cell wall biosynthesis
MIISIIIPVHNGGETFRRCLKALSQTKYEPWECIVVDDGSTDHSVAIAHEYGARVVTGLKRRQGPAQARNVGAQIARGDILFFVDADVLVQPGTVGHLAATMKTDPELAACFGSYDDSPTETNFLSQYRNLQHHYVHQNSNSEASTFWSGCGAIRRQTFLEMGGFDAQAYPRPSIEDIELGYRLRAAGHQIHLEKLLQVRHMKRWTPRQMLVTDIRDRALPWTKLILQDCVVLNDLNLQTAQRVSTAVALLGLLSLGLALFSGWWLLFVGLAMSILLWLNRHFYLFLAAKRGWLFAVLAIPWHWFYFVYSGLSFAVGLFLYRLKRLEPSGVKGLRPLPSTPISASRSPQTRSSVD